jgi:hypothetical protein
VPLVNMWPAVAMFSFRVSGTPSISRAPPCVHRRTLAFGLPASKVGLTDTEGVQRMFTVIDACQHGIHDLHRGDLAGGEASDQLGCRQGDQLGTGLHLVMISSFAGKRRAPSPPCSVAEATSVSDQRLGLG